MVSIRGLSKAFGDKKVLDGVDFDFPDAAVTSIAGPSGTGKTTLANLLLGLMEPDSGEILGCDGLRKAAVFQEDRLIEHMSALENIRLTAHPDADVAEMRRALASVGLDPDDAQRVSKYSGGMKRRVAIVRAVLARPQLLILDEPFKGLDEAIRADCAKYILDACPESTILLITHDSTEAELMCATAQLTL